MCGICGIVNFNNVPLTETPIKVMMQAMKHRGPDDEGTYFNKNIGLGFVRLSIIDLSYAGHQPMISNDGRYIIIFNGEIFNYIELKKKLEGFYSFKSQSDTEVLLASYMKWGIECLDRLNGMFSFVILDADTMEVFAARDRFGIKPFYYLLDENRFIFASDIPPILKVLHSKPKANYSNIYDFLVYNRTNHNNQTFFLGINKLNHGYYIHITGNELKIKRWYQLTERVQNLNHIKYSSSLFAKDFRNSIMEQMQSDVPIGVCLSGGIDSSSITSLIQKNFENYNCYTFSAMYGKGIMGDESRFIELINPQGLDMHYTFPSAISLLKDINHFQEALSEPITNTSEYAEFKVMELAKDYCTVILNGQGADEMMAGYHYFFGYYFKDLLRQFKFFQLFSELTQYLSIHKSLMGIQSFGFAMMPGLFRNHNTSRLNDDFKMTYSKIYNPIVDDFYNSSSLQEFLIKHFEYKLEHHLLWADKSGMYFSLETRFPFLNHTLVENTLAAGITIQNGRTKHLLREATKGVLPEEIRTRVDKTGYLTPEMMWFNEPTFKEFFLDIVHSISFRSRNLLDNSKCQKAINEYEKTGKYQADFWKWLSLELWFRKYIDGE
jgi:asparagine synthase (glutamine-hydrolysing)